MTARARARRTARDVAVAGALGAAALAAGCVSYVPRIDDADVLRLDAARQSAGTCAVVESRGALGAGKSPRADRVRATGLFSAVHPVASSADAVDEDWILREEVIPGRLYEPFFTLVTLGILPYVADDDVPHLWFAWRVGGADGDAIRVEWTQRHAWVMGWLGLPLAMLPSWTFMNSGTSEERAAERLGVELLRAGVAR